MGQPKRTAREVKLEGPDKKPSPPFYYHYRNWLTRALVQRFGGMEREHAEDLVQEAYIQAAPYEAKGAIVHPRAFLLKVASNLARNHLRRLKRQGALVPIEDLDEMAECGVAADQDETVLLKQLVLALPAPLRDVFVMSRFGMTNLQIAEKLGLSVKTVEGRMTKALTLLAAQLRGSDVDAR